MNARAGDSLRALPWSLEIPLDGSPSRHVLIRIATRSAFPRDALTDAGIEIPTRFGVFFAHPKRLAEECDLSLRTVRRIIKSLVACGILLREKNNRFLIDTGLVRNKRHNLPIAYYANTRVDERAAKWVTEASFVAKTLITDSPQVAAKKKTPAGRTMSDYPADLVAAMRQLVPSDIWPPGYGPEDALYELDSIAAEPEPAAEDLALEAHATTEGESASLSGAPGQGSGWATATIPDQTPTANSADDGGGGGAESEPTPPDERSHPDSATQEPLPVAGVTSLTEKQAARDQEQQSTKAHNRQINEIVWQFRTGRADAGKPVAEESDRTWWRKMRALVGHILLDGASPTVIVSALHAVDLHTPLEWQVRTHLPAQFQAKVARPGRGEAVAAANDGASHANSADVAATNDMITATFELGTGAG